MGYSVAWERRWALLAVLVPVLIPASLILLGLRLLSGLDDTAVINGDLVAPAPQGLGGIVYALAAGLAWLFAVSAGVAAIGSPSPGTVKAVLKALPSLAFWVAAGVAATVTAFALGPFAVALLAILFVAVFGRLALMLPATVLDGAVPARANELRVGLRIAVGVIVVPLLYGWVFTTVIRPLPEYFPSVVTAVVVQVMALLLMMIVVAGQAGTLAVIYFDLREEDLPSPGPSPRRWLAIAALALPVLATVVLTPVNGPLITVRRNVLQGAAEQIVWNVAAPDRRQPRHRR